MANTINIQAALTLQTSTALAIQAAGTLPVTQTGSKGVTSYKNLTTSNDPISFTGLATLGFLFVQNLDGTNSVVLSIGSTSPPDFATLGPNQFCLIPINQATVPTINARASAGTPQIAYAAVEK